jgi:hypothetical protein
MIHTSTVYIYNIEAVSEAVEDLEGSESDPDLRAHVSSRCLNSAMKSRFCS